MVLLLSNDDVRASIEGIDVHARAVEVLERALIDMAGDDAKRMPHVTPTPGQGAVSVITAMGLLPAARLIGGRVNCVGRPRGGGRPTHNAYKMVFDLETLGLVALLEDGPIHGPMLAARIAIATQRLARSESRRVGVLGSGRMAREGLSGVLRALADIEQVFVFSPDHAHRESFAQEMQSSSGIPTQAVSEAREAVTGMDVVLCATNSYFRGGLSVLQEDWITPGTHINSIARGEIDAETYRRARIFPSSLLDLLAIRPPWDDLENMKRDGAISLEHDLGQVLAGAALGRSKPEDVTVFVGASTGAEHLAIGQWIYGEARTRGLGHEWDLDR